jgi:dihydroorotate dehydrogenase
MGFAFVKVRSVTPRPQPGNTRPWNFCLPADWDVINQFRYNPEGVQRVGKQLREYVMASTTGSNDGPMNNVLRDKKEQVEVGDTTPNPLRWALGWELQRIMVSEHRTGVMGVNLG